MSIYSFLFCRLTQKQCTKTRFIIIFYNGHSAAVFLIKLLLCRRTDGVPDSHQGPRDSFSCPNNGLQHSRGHRQNGGLHCALGALVPVGVDRQLEQCVSGRVEVGAQRVVALPQAFGEIGRLVGVGRDSLLLLLLLLARMVRDCGVHGNEHDLGANQDLGPNVDRLHRGSLQEGGGGLLKAVDKAPVSLILLDGKQQHVQCGTAHIHKRANRANARGHPSNLRRQMWLPDGQQTFYQLVPTLDSVDLCCHQMNLSTLKLEDVAQFLNLPLSETGNVEDLGLVIHFQGDGTDLDLLKERWFHRFGLWLVLLTLGLLCGDGRFVGEVPTDKLKGILVNMQANRELERIKNKRK